MNPNIRSGPVKIRLVLPNPFLKLGCRIWTLVCTIICLRKVMNIIKLQKEWNQNKQNSLNCFYRNGQIRAYYTVDSPHVGSLYITIYTLRFSPNPFDNEESSNHFFYPLFWFIFTLSHSQGRKLWRYINLLKYCTVSREVQWVHALFPLKPIVPLWSLDILAEKRISS